MSRNEEFAKGHGRPVCLHCGNDLEFNPHWEAEVADQRTPQDQIDEAYLGTELPEGVEVPRSKYHNDPEFRHHIDMLETNRGWRHVRDHLSAPHLGIDKGTITTDHPAVPHDGRTDREESMRQFDVLLDMRNRNRKR